MKLKTLIVGSAAVAMAAWLGACGTPTPHCLVVGSPSGSGYPYWMKYLDADPNASDCKSITGDNIGFQVYNKPRTNDFSLGWRAQAIGGQIYLVGNTSTEIDAANCMGVSGCNSQENPKSNGSATMPAFPTNNVCEMSTFVASEQHFDAIPPTLDDDGGVTDPGAPATTVTMNFTKLRFANSTNAPGTVFDGELDYTQDTCTFHTKVFGLWPAIGCFVDADCNPVADPDAGYVSGSGLNPTFVDSAHPVKCNTTVPYNDPFGDDPFDGICEISYTSVDDINAIKVQ